ncbi:Isochorismatase hydrolase [Tothia fuscella]|uniref:Isochorismatase hydrolase n=1 Tax=Tothia fuscella TaxID=1048955 RepID=A0A9P4TZB3_9PEZI|nr:Isochorismatase hydrolase [Tothia fuscella]
MSSSTPSFRNDILGISPSTASTKDSTLIIIDAQNEYDHGKLKISNISTSRPAIAALLEKYRAANGKIIHVKHSVPEGAPVFTPSTELAEEFEEVAAKGKEEVINKSYPGSFAETRLKELLGDDKKLVLVGYMAHVCVSTTAREAHQLGYEVILPEDAIGDRDIPGATGSDVTKMVLLELGDMFGTVIKSSDIT